MKKIILLLLNLSLKTTTSSTHIKTTPTPKTSFYTEHFDEQNTENYCQKLFNYMISWAGYKSLQSDTQASESTDSFQHQPKKINRKERKKMHRQTLLAFKARQKLIAPQSSYSNLTLYEQWPSDKKSKNTSI